MQSIKAHKSLAGEFACSQVCYMNANISSVPISLQPINKTEYHSDKSFGATHNWKFRLKSFFQSLTRHNFEAHKRPEALWPQTVAAYSWDNFAWWKLCHEAFPSSLIKPHNLAHMKNVDISWFLSSLMEFLQNPSTYSQNEGNEFRSTLGMQF